MAKFEEVIQKIHEEISINNEDREAYTKDFDSIYTWIMDELKEKSYIFRRMYHGKSLFGSYLEDLKIGKPDEFDVHFKLEIPFQDHMKLQRIMQSVTVNMEQVLPLLSKNSNFNDIHNFLENLCYDGTTILSGEKLQDWFEILFEEIFANNSKRLTGAGGFDYQVSYRKCLTAHTITARSNNTTRNLDIDLVPGFEFRSKKKTKQMFNGKYPNDKKPKTWFLVPKPKNGRASFSVSAPQAEKDALWDKANLKSSMRLLKSLRDKTDCNVKSYYIRTCYLNECKKQPKKFWQKPIGYLLIHMVRVLFQCLRNKFIPSYWDPEQNILTCLSPAKLQEAIKQFEYILEDLETFSKKNIVSYAQVRELFGEPSSY